jgi:hypothetical protein
MVLRRIRRGNGRDGLMLAGIERTAYGVDPFDAGCLQLLAQLTVHQDDGLSQGIGRRVPGVVHDAIEIVEDIDQPDYKGCLGTIGQLDSFLGNSLSIVVELCGETEVPVSCLRDLVLEPAHSFRRRLRWNARFSAGGPASDNRLFGRGSVGGRRLLISLAVVWVFAAKPLVLSHLHARNSGVSP